MFEYAVLIVAITILQLLLAGYARSNGEVPGARAFSWFLVGAALWAGATGMEAVAPTWALVPLASVKWTGIALVPSAWFAFLLSYLGFDLSRRVKAALSIEPIVVVLAIATNPLFGSLWRVTGVVHQGGFPMLEVVRGPIFYVHTAYAYALVSTTMVLILGVAILTPRFRARVLGLLAGLAFPLAANVAYLTGTSPYGLDFTPVAFFASGLVFGWLLFADKLFDVPPIAPWVAHRVAFHAFADAVVVLDVRGDVVECNDAASRIFDRRANDLVGESFQSLVADRFGIDLPPPSTTPTIDAQLRHDGQIRHYVLRVTELTPAERLDRGYLASLQDVTEREVQQQRLAVLNRVLRHNVRNDMNVVAGFGDLIAVDSDDPAIEQYAENITSRAHQLARWSDRARQAENVLDGAATSTSTLDLDETLDTITDRVRASHPGGTVTVSGPTAFDVAAPTTLGDALVELVTNGIEHNDTDHPQVSILIEPDDVGGLAVVVADNGGGPSPGELPSLDDEREPLAHGIGFGLWFVSWTAWALGGELTTRPTDDGVAVVIRLPAARVTPSGDGAANHEPSADPPNAEHADRSPNAAGSGDGADGSGDVDEGSGDVDDGSGDGADRRGGVSENTGSSVGSRGTGRTGVSATDGGSDPTDGTDGSDDASAENT